MLDGLAPLVALNTRVLILGSFPGERSLQLQQYYGHPRNQFWRLIFAVLEKKVPKLANDWEKVCLERYEIRSAELLAARVGLWDVYARCEREGSLDTAIRSAQLNDLAGLFKQCPQLQAIAHNGAQSYKHAQHTLALGLPVYQFPSSSPANATWSFERKLSAWLQALSPHL